MPVQYYSVFDTTSVFEPVHSQASFNAGVRPKGSKLWPIGGALLGMFVVSVVLMAGNDGLPPFWCFSPDHILVCAHDADYVHLCT